MKIIDSAEIHLPAHLRETLGQGDTILVSDGTRPIAFLVSAEAPSIPRPFGLCMGEFEVPEEFNAPSPEIEALFYDGR